MSSSYRKLVAVVGAVAATLAMAGPAAADPGNGAYVDKYSACDTYPGWGTYCVDAKYVSNATQAKSGNWSVFSNGEYTSSFTGEGQYAGCSSSSADKFSYHSLWKQDDSLLQEDKSKARGGFTQDCFGYVYNCTHDIQFHFANGKVQIARFDVICT